MDTLKVGMQVNTVKGITGKIRSICGKDIVLLLSDSSTHCCPMSHVEGYHPASIGNEEMPGQMNLLQFL